MLIEELLPEVYHEYSLTHLKIPQMLSFFIHIVESGIGLLHKIERW
jgi:hypothetical protein